MTNFMLYGSVGGTGAPLEATLVTISGSTTAIVGVLASLATVGLLLVGMVAQRCRTRWNRTTGTLTVDPAPWCRTAMTRSTLPFWVVLVAVCGRVATTHAAAVLIPDHTFILGSCGGPQGNPCDWQCGTGKTCAGGGQCQLQLTAGFSAALVAKVDAAPCAVGASGSVLSLGLAGTIGGNPFQMTDTAFDLCEQDIPCTGREPRDCTICPAPGPDDTLCISDDGQGNYPCPPGDVVFFCKDPCAGSGPGFGFFTEDDINIFSAWFSETRQPLPEVMRAGLPSEPAVGRPVVYHATTQLFPAGDPPVTRLCVRVAWTTQDKTIAGNTPAAVNPPVANAVVSPSVCSGGTRPGRPCGNSGDCGGGSCTPLPASASSTFCSGSLAACVNDTSCPSGETCIGCPAAACGDGVLDPGEACDDGGTITGDGCDASCAVESCWSCDSQLGETSLCFFASGGTTCDADGTPCTVDDCDGFGGCIAGGGALAGCALPVTGKAKLAVKVNALVPSKTKFKWKWLSAAAFDTSSLGTPATTDDLTVCVYDQTGLRDELSAPAGGTCGTKPCWTVEASKVKYLDKEGTPEGVTKVQAKSGAPGAGKLLVVGKGVNLSPALPLTLPARVVAVRENGPACWEATYSAAKANAAEGFQAISD